MKFLLLLKPLGAVLTMLTLSATAWGDTVRFIGKSNDAHLLELYTSQGCSSCPPAERWLSNFKNDQRLWKTLFPVAFHVDYWDYIGWKDEFAHPLFGKRQQLYRYFGNIKQVATPGFVYGGKGWNGWFHGQKLTAGKPFLTEGALTVDINGRDVMAAYQPRETRNDSDESYRLNVVRLGFDLTSKIDDGENEGRQLHQDFVVLSYDAFFMLDSLSDRKESASQGGQKEKDVETWRASMKLYDHQKYHPEKMAIVAWVSYGLDPTPLQVTGGWLKAF